MFHVPIVRNADPAPELLCRYKVQHVVATSIIAKDCCWTYHTCSFGNPSGLPVLRCARTERAARQASQHVYHCNVPRYVVMTHACVGYTGWDLSRSQGCSCLADLLFRQLFDAESSTYTYILADPATKEGVIIDCVLEQVGCWDRWLAPCSGHGSTICASLPY